VLSGALIGAAISIAMIIIIAVSSKHIIARMPNFCPIFISKPYFQPIIWPTILFLSLEPEFLLTAEVKPSKVPWIL
jgi:hypothetical protein